MKFLALVLIAGATTISAMGDDTSRGLATLAEKWNITDPTFAYSSLDFTLDYTVSDFIIEGMQSASIFDEGCKEGGNVVDPTVLIPDLVDIVGTKGDGDLRRTASFKVSVNSEKITTDANIYEEFTGANGELTAVVTFCVRFGLSTTGTPAVEVNFHETLITLNVRLTDGFEIENISVQPKDKLVRTANQIYELEAFQCDEDNAALDTTGLIRNQGSVIRVCVRPNLDARNDGIKMREIQSLFYKFGSTTITQIAVAESEASDDGLSDLDCDAGADTCVIETILTADFYRTAGVVTGEGVGSMQFGSRRRLRSNERALQQDSAGESQFDLSVETKAAADNTTSGGASTTGVCSLMLLAFFSGAMALL